MTVAISAKVHAGLILGADSASTMITRDASGNNGVLNVYNNANKVFNLVKGLPVGAISWGAGSIGSSSIETLFKDFRAANPAEEIRSHYSVKGLAEKFTDFLYKEKYQPTFSAWKDPPALGFLIAGYSPASGYAEEYNVFITGNSISGPALARGPEECGLSWNGEPEAISRLYLGFSPQLPQVAANALNLKPDDLTKLLNALRLQLNSSMIAPAMPIKDAIDLVDFLIRTTIDYSRFTPGAPTVGGPIEIAAITKHEGFRWIKRKHYFDSELNP